MSFKILVINPGSTSTKIGVYEDETLLFDKTLRHSAEDIAQFNSIPAQKDWRCQLVLKALREENFDINTLSAVSGRGGLLRPIRGGTYAVNDNLVNDCTIGVQGQHASNLGGIIAREIGDSLGIPSYIVDPVVVDELADVARYAGHPLFQRVSIFHALNQKAVAKRFAKEHGKNYEDLNLIVCHLGGGVSVGAHQHGRVVDVCNVKDEGAMGMDRGGGLPVNQLIDYCFSGKTRAEVKKTLGRRAGMFSYLGTTDFRVVCAKKAEGDQQAAAAYEALVYQLAKDIGTMAAVLHFNVDAIVYTGGMAYEQSFCDDITAYVGKLAPVLRLPGEEEMRSLAEGALRVLRGQQEAGQY